MYTTGVPVLRLCNVTQHSSVNTYKHCTSVTFNLFLLHGHPKLRHGPGCRFEMLVIDFDDKEAENVFFFIPHICRHVRKICSFVRIIALCRLYSLCTVYKFGTYSILPYLYLALPST